MKKCPYCAEEVKNEAIICPHCKESLGSKNVRMLNRTQKTIGIIFAVIILIASLGVAGESALAAIIGLSVSAGLLIYCLSGKSVSKNKISQNARKLIFGIATIVAIIVAISLISTYWAEQKKKEVAWKRLEMNFQYLKNIAMLSSNIGYENNLLYGVDAYLYLTLRNNGRKNLNSVTMELSYYDSGNYLIKKTYVRTPRGEWIKGEEEQKYKILLSHGNAYAYPPEPEQYPYSQRETTHHFEAKISSCDVSIFDWSTAKEVK